MVISLPGIHFFMQEHSEIVKTLVDIFSQSAWGKLPVNEKYKLTNWKM